jgi:hypothetical protein
MTTPEAFLFVGTLLVVMLHTNPLVLYFVASAGCRLGFRSAAKTQTLTLQSLSTTSECWQTCQMGRLENCTKEARGTTIVRALASWLAWVSDQLRKQKP